MSLPPLNGAGRCPAKGILFWIQNGSGIALNATREGATDTPTMVGDAWARGEESSALYDPPAAAGGGDPTNKAGDMVVVSLGRGDADDPFSLGNIGGQALRWASRLSQR